MCVAWWCCYSGIMTEPKCVSCSSFAWLLWGGLTHWVLKEVKSVLLPCCRKGSAQRGCPGIHCLSVGRAAAETPETWTTLRAAWSSLRPTHTPRAASWARGSQSEYRRRCWHYAETCGARQADSIWVNTLQCFLGTHHKKIELNAFHSCFLKAKLACMSISADVLL